MAVCPPYCVLHVDSLTRIYRTDLIRHQTDRTKAIRLNESTLLRPPLSIRNERPQRRKSGVLVPHLNNKSSCILSRTPWIPNTLTTTYPTKDPNLHYRPLNALSTLWNTAMQLSQTNSSSPQMNSIIAKSHLLLTHQRDTYGGLYPQKRLPNVKEFRVEVVKDYHPIFKEKGIKKRKYFPILHTEAHSNRSLNRYIQHQFIRLNKHLTQPRTFWRIGETLLHRSSSYAALLVHETFDGWHRYYSYHTIWNYLKHYRTMSLTDYRYKRRSIPKSDGSLRYLGVPTPTWRMYHHGLSLILQVWLHPYSHPSQHGFQQGRGTNSAWNQIHREVLGSSDIYEFDMKKYFDTVNLDYLGSILRGTQLPESIIRLILHWNRTPPVGHPPSILSWRNEYDQTADYKYHKCGEYGFYSSSDYWDWRKHYWLSQSSHPEHLRYDYFHGLSQGSPLSPLLSTLPLTWELLLDPYCKIVQYADDGILYDLLCRPEDILTFSPESGLSYHVLKSGWLRENWKWVRALRYLGQTFNGINPLGIQNQGGSLHNSTHISRPYQFEDYKLILAAAEYDKAEYLRKPPSPKRRFRVTMNFDDWFETHYHGYVCSRLYSGQLEIPDLRQDFSYKFTNNSWSELEGFARINRSTFNRSHRDDSVKLTIFNSSSFAARFLSQQIQRRLATRKTCDFELEY